MLRCTSPSLTSANFISHCNDFPFWKSSSLGDRFFRRGPLNRRSVAVASVKFSVEEVADVLQNKVLISSVLACAIGQLSKPFTSALRGNGFDLGAVVRSGGMPSTHSAGVTAATTCLGLERGFSDPIFGVSAVFATLVMYDAQGVRREVGRHAKNLNKMMIRSQEKSTLLEEEQSPVKAGSFDSLSSLNQAQNCRGLLKKQSPVDYFQEIGDGPLLESVGHTEAQVLAGALLGFLVSLSVETLIN